METIDIIAPDLIRSPACAGKMGGSPQRLTQSSCVHVDRVLVLLQHAERRMQQLSSGRRGIRFGAKWDNI